MNLILALLLAFPAERIGTLPTGRVLDDGVWQIGISHRFLPAADNTRLGSPVSFLKDANVRFSVERGLPAGFHAGVSYNNAGSEVGVNGAWAPVGTLTALASLGTNVVDPRQANTWFCAGVAGHIEPDRALHLVALPRLTSNLATGDDHRLYLSVGLGAKAAIGAGFSVGAETEPVLTGPFRQLLAWNVVLDKELGWHNFTLVVGNSWYQSVPGWFAFANRDITKGMFRVGFNILRKL